ncbi:energy transducer TonB [Burkholderia gladioli]|uniref:energy transducer TonB n=1 Tax=Burkholderia gladioli TaxID=28095 RepID=UPI001F207188|nr:energy transducer TonB [Burkholderia gladioli]MCH7269754.1 TonB family protein [Burkholderia gladioli]MDZ4037325.1 TonB family protein [Burkholderia gladioli pv. alliicola]
MSGSEHLANLRSRCRRAAVALAVVMVHGLGLYLILHHSVHLIRLEADRAAGASVQVRLVAAPTPQPVAKPEPRPERPPEPKPRPIEKPVVRKTAPLLSSEAPAERSVAPAKTEAVKPVEPAPPPPVPTPSAAPAPAPTPLAPAPGPNLLDTPKQISSAELKQLGCRIPRPDYPPKAKRLEQEGTVLVRLTIGADGAVKTARVARSSGYPLLDAAALTSIEAGRCQPYTTAGIARAVEAEQPIAFNLND